MIGSCLLAATDVSTRVRCEAIAGHDEPVIRIENGDGVPSPPPSDLIAAVAGSGIRIEAEPSAVSISCPR